MEINLNLVPESKYPIKCPYNMTPIGICVHNTANDASAKNEIAYMVRNDKQTSFHFAVDYQSIWQGVLLNRNAWHAGDGNGEGNRKYIGIEICYSKSGGTKFDKSEDNAAKLIADLLKERKWGIDRVRKHQDFSGKYCPHRTLDLGWSRFLSKVRSNMGEQIMGEDTPLEACHKDREKFMGEIGELHRSLNVENQGDALEEILRLQTVEVDAKEHKCPEEITIELDNRIETGSEEYDYNEEGQRIRKRSYKPVEIV